jgi:hypothetical protein
MRIIFTLIFCLLFGSFTFAQLTPPKTEGLFGGSMLDITGYTLNSDTTVIFVSTESPNSVFRAKVKTSPTQLIADSFEVLPSLSSEKGFGSNINSLAADSINRYLFFAHSSGLYYTTETGASAVQLENLGIQTLAIKDSILLYIMNGSLHFKKIRPGNIVNSGISGIGIGTPSADYSIAIHPINKLVYVLVRGNTPTLYKSNVPYHSLTSSSSFTLVSIPNSWPGVNWEGLGVAPEGRILLGGSDQTGKKILYSDNESTWNFINTTIPGRAVKKISFSGNASNYNVFFGTAVSKNKGLNWINLGSVFQETHPNDGNVFVAHGNQNCIFFNTDGGLGASYDNGDAIFEINNGIEALQINGLDMNLAKTGAWIASKAGLRKVTNYQSPVKKWSAAMFPNGDGSPYFSVGLVNNDTNRVYAGNTRVYKTTDGGKTWAMVFTPEGPPYNFPSFNIRMSKIAVCPFDTNLILISYSADAPNKGGFFYSTNAGGSWTQLRIASTSIGQDININDISITKEGNDTIAYIALNYDGTSSMFRGLFRLVKQGAGWTVNPNMDASNAADGKDIISQIEDLELNLGGDSLFAAGVDYSNGIAQYQTFLKPINGSNKWERLKTNGFPSLNSTKIKVALGKDTLYAAVNEELMVFPLKDSVWFRAYQYPVGSNINFLYYDELLAGTGVGLYGHLGKPTECRPVLNDFNPSICYNDFITLPDSTKINTSGRYQFLYKNKNGCDSIVTITLTVNRPDVSISVKKDTLISNDSAATAYQWLDCDMNFSPIANATSRSFKPINAGNFAVKVSRAFCTDTSACFFVQANALEKVQVQALQVYPNPSKGEIHLKGDWQIPLNLQIIDVFGKLVLNQTIVAANQANIKLTHLPAGLYILRLSSIENSKELVFSTRLILLDQTE